MNNPQEAAKLAALNEFIVTQYEGQFEVLVRQLQETIYMLHYLDPELFDEVKRTEKVFILYCIAECLSADR